MFSESEVASALWRASNKLGYSKLRSQQERVVKAFVLGRDVFVSLPTGSGKSLCYCLLPFVFDALYGIDGKSVVVVVSPLISLMKDQVRAMKARDVRAVYVGDCTEDEREAMNICSGEYQLVYMSPESLLTNEQWRDMLLSPIYRENLVGLVVDEAHCVKKWGETFRKEFMSIGEARSLVPDNVRMMALTATATKTTRQQVCRCLGMVKPLLVTESPNRSNIKFIVKAADNIEETFAPLVEETRRLRVALDKIIVFCRTYDDCSHIYLFLRSRLGREGVQPIGAPDLSRFRLVELFTACTEKGVKDAILESFSNPFGTLRVVIATIAFGMGLDCPNVRRIIHWGPSSDVEAYIQETGRAGRDGEPAEAILYTISHPGNRFVDDSMKVYMKNKEKCRREILLADFDGSVDFCASCSCCDVCEAKCTCQHCS